MKKIGYILLCLLILNGCVVPGNIDKNTVLGDARLIKESSLPVVKEEKKADIPKEDEELKEKTDFKEAFTAELKAELMRKQQDLYHFSTLEITQQNIYVEILYALENYVEEMEISTTDAEQIDKVFQYVLMDHPEIFYVDGYSFVKYTLGEEVKKITFRGTYVYDEEEKERREALIENAVSEMAGGIREDATDYEKVKYVYEYIIKNTEYNMSVVDNQNICSVFLNHASVCQGYAKAVQYMLMKLKVPCTLVVGTVESGEGHAWNLVKVDNQYYYLDATWGDASYLFQMQEEQEIQNSPAINYDYLCVTTNEILRTHSLADLVSMPICEAIDANYYVKEGAYFTEVNFTQLEQLIQKYQGEGRKTVTLHCLNEEVYQDMLDELVDKQKIFHYLQGADNSILYTDAPKQLSITFWL